MGGVGSSTAGLAFGGQSAQDETESWNGSAWTELNDMNQSRTALAGAGTQTAALGFGGQDTPPTTIAGKTEDWNGVSWVEVADLSTSRYYLGGAGTSTLGLASGGYNPPTYYANTEEWSGSSNTVKVLTD